MIIVTIILLAFDLSLYVKSYKAMVEFIEKLNYLRQSVKMFYSSK